MATTNPEIPIPILLQVVAGRAPPLEPLTIEQVEQMMKHGILPDGAPLELIDGVLVHKDRSARGEDPITHNPAHAVCLSRLLNVMVVVQGLGFHLRCQLPVALLPTRAPEPDLAIIRGAPEDYRGRHPGPNDIVAVFEVADSSLDYDRAKQRLYASAGIPIYWIANLIDNLIEAYQRPNITTEKYDVHIDYKMADVIELYLRNNSSIPIRVDDIIG